VVVVNVEFRAMVVAHFTEESASTWKFAFLSSQNYPCLQTFLPNSIGHTLVQLRSN
jgi:hypothetical protein